MYSWDWGRSESSSVSLCVSCSAVYVKGALGGVGCALGSHGDVACSIQVNNSWVTWKGLHVSFKGSILGISGKFLGDLENGVGGWHEASHTVTKFVSSLSLTENVQERIRTDTSPNGPGLVDCTFALLPWQNDKEVRDVWESCETGIRPRNTSFLWQQFTLVK